MLSELTLEQKLDFLHHDRNDSWLWLIRQITNPLIRNSFDTLETQGLDDVVSASQDNQLTVYISDHESEIDWILLQRIFSEQEISTVIQAGDNLFVPGLGYVLKKTGGFMSIRDEHIFRVHGRKHTIDKKEYAFKLYEQQLERILGDEGNNILIFPSYAVDQYTGEQKVGRSYDGKYNAFTPVVFARVIEAAKKRGLSVMFREVKISYERVAEDTAFREFKNMSGKSKLEKNVYDHLNTFVLSPWQKRVRNIKPRVVVKFGEKYPAEGKGKDLADEIHEGIGKLLRVYPSQLIFASTDDKYKISKKELWDNVQRNAESLDAYGLDISPVINSKGLIPLDEMLCRIERLFNYKKIPIVATRNYQTIEHDSNEVFIWHPHLARYYGNKLNYVLKP